MRSFISSAICRATWLRIGRAALLAACSILASAAALAAGCPSGQRGVDPQCEVLLAREERALKRVEAQVEAQLRARTAEEGGDADYAQFSIEHFHAAQKAWRAFRKAQCLYLPLRDGMSSGYDGEVTVLCMINMTRQRRKELGQGLRPD